MTPARTRLENEGLSALLVRSKTESDRAGDYQGLLRQYQTLQRSESALRESGELLRAIINSSAVGIAVLTAGARFIEANEAFCSITGYTEAEILVLDWAALRHPEDCARMSEQLSELLSGHVENFIIEERYFRKDGRTIWVQNNVSLTPDTDNRASNIIAVCQDITERKEAENALRDSQAQLAAELADTRLLRDISAELIEQGDEKTLHEKIVEAVATIMRSDFATMQMFYPERGARGELGLLASRGLDEEGKKLWGWVAFSTDSTCGQALRTSKRAIASNVESSDFLAGTAGGAALLEAGIRAAQSTPLFSRSGRFVGMISSHWRQPYTPSKRDLRLLDILARQAADVIERRRADDELRRVNQDLEQFAYSASHDLQEPLRTIKIYSELLPKRFGGALDTEATEYLGFLRSAATRMEMLVRDLLTYTQVSQRPAVVEKTDTAKVLQEALANLGGAIGECEAEIGIGPLPVVRMDETHLRQLFQNLIGNAVKYRSPERACAVRISAECNGESVIFSVRDNGIGIEPEYREQVFGLFKRLHGADTHSGTGIGLAICQRIVERYHGRIWVESEAGMGSDFRFALPV